jgi:hypothetical protein
MSLENGNATSTQGVNRPASGLRKPELATLTGASDVMKSFAPDTKKVQAIGARHLRMSTLRKAIIMSAGRVEIS